MKKLIFVTLFLIFCCGLSGLQLLNTLSWEKLDDGLFLSEYTSPIESSLGNNIITIVKIDPTYYDFNLFSSKEKNEEAKTAKLWGKQENLSIVVNAGMYNLDDYATNMGYMKDYDFVNNPKLNHDNAIAVFNRKDETVPEVQIIDLKCQDWDVLKTKYNSFTQSIRMVDCKQTNRWSEQDKKWSMVVMGTDKSGNVLLIFTRSPYAVHDFINILLSAPLDLYNLMYLEGGPEASLYINHNGTTIAKMGSYETGFNEDDDNNMFWDVPNVIGITKK